MQYVFTVYLLTLHGAPIYVGCTVNTKARLRTHRKKWLGVEMRILSVEVEVPSAAAREQQWINFFRGHGVTLFNNRSQRLYRFRKTQRMLSILRASEHAERERIENSKKRPRLVIRRIQISMCMSGHEKEELSVLAKSIGMTKSTLARRAFEVGLAMIKIDRNALTPPATVRPVANHDPDPTGDPTEKAPS